MAETLDRQYVSQFGTDELTLAIYVGGSPGDPDGSTVTASLVDERTSAPVFIAEAAMRTTIGQYQVQLTSAQSAQPDNYTLTWNYTISGVPQEYQAYIEIGKASPAYDFLAPGMKNIIENVYNRFRDLYDSVDGGPNLSTYFQANFGRGRIAQLLRAAVTKINTMAQPFMTFSIDQGGAMFPFQQWGGLLEQALVVEVVRHLRRSYVEQPEIQGGSVTRLDRRDYMQRWGEILQEEEDILKQERDVFKISAMSLARPAVLVSGGVYGRFGPTRYAGSMAARPRYWTRWY